MTRFKIRDVRLNLSSKPALPSHFCVSENGTIQPKNLGAGLGIAHIYSVTKFCSFSAS